jgi:virginiamycin B lyase
MQVPVGAPGAGPYALASGPDGALWVTLVHSGEIARVSVDGTVAVHALGAPKSRPSRPHHDVG